MYMQVQLLNQNTHQQYNENKYFIVSHLDLC
jgi:hypothetical protein